MSLLSQMVLIERHGLRVDLDRLAVILETTPANLRRKVSDGTLGIPTYLDGGKRWADTRDVAAYFDSQRERANLQASGSRNASANSMIYAR